MKSNVNNNHNGSNEYQKAIDFLKKGCKCGCSSRIPKENFAELRESFQALSKSEQHSGILFLIDIRTYHVTRSTQSENTK